MYILYMYYVKSGIHYYKLITHIIIMKYIKKTTNKIIICTLGRDSPAIPTYMAIYYTILRSLIIIHHLITNYPQILHVDTYNI